MKTKVGPQFLLSRLLFLLPAAFCAAANAQVSDELNPVKIVPKLIWKKTASDNKPSANCSLDISDEEDNVIKSVTISAPVFEAKVVNSKTGNDLANYEAKIRELGFGINRVKFPSSAFYIGSIVADGACGGVSGYVRIREGKAQVVCIDQHIDPCSGAGDDDDEPEQKITSAYSVIVSREFLLSELSSGNSSSVKSEKAVTNKK